MVNGIKQNIEIPYKMTAQVAAIGYPKGHTWAVDYVKIWIQEKRETSYVMI